MTPTIIVKNGKPHWVIGSPGGQTIISTNVQVTVNLIDFGMNRLGLGYIGPDRFYGWIWRPDDQQQVMVDGQNKILKTFHAVARDRFSKKIPQAKNQISAIRISRDYVFIFRFAMNKTDKSRSFFIDIFTRKGEFTGVAQLDDLPLFISERAMYFDRTDESGNVFLVRTEYSLPKFISEI